MTFVAPDRATALSRAITVVGVPAVLALGLVYWLTTSVDRRLVTLQAAISQHETLRARDMQHMNAFLYAICLNTASVAIAAARCAVALEGDQWAAR